MKLVKLDDVLELIDGSMADLESNYENSKLQEEIKRLPTMDAEPTEEQVKEYCRKRGLVIVDSELFNEMKARWSAEPVKQERCEFCKDGKTFLNSEWVLGNDSEWHRIRYCPNCGAKMDSEGESGV